MKPKQMDPLVEKVARAIHRVNDSSFPWEYCDDGFCDYQRKCAAAAIRTIRRHDGDGWRDAVSDPPTDCVDVLGWRNGEPVIMSRISRDDPSRWGDLCEGGYFTPVMPPQYWRPLPPPPKAKAVKS